MKAKCSLACEFLSRKDYVDLLWTTLSEFPGRLLGGGRSPAAEAPQGHSGGRPVWRTPSLPSPPPGVLVTLWIIDWVGRRKTMALSFLVFSFCSLLLFLCVGR